jgi:hypothetical protein
MPAVDLLKLDANEGQEAPPKLSILFACKSIYGPMTGSFN